ncbi:MBL fold metallo-hydrolase [Streptomyces sp. SBR177]
MNQRLRRLLGTGSAAACAIALLAGCANGPGAEEPGASRSPGTPRTPQTKAAPPGRFASADPGSVNTYWIAAPDGLVVIDTLRTPADARKAIEAIRKTGTPVAAVLLTHAHPDHVGGAGAFHEAFPDAPLYASASTDRAMREDKRGFYPLARSANSAFPARITYADRTFKDGTPLQVAGLRFETATYDHGESDTATVYYRPDTGDLFAGDLATSKVTPALLEGNSCGWLQILDALGRRFPKPGRPTPDTACRAPPRSSPPSSATTSCGSATSSGPPSPPARPPGGRSPPTSRGRSPPRWGAPTPATRRSRTCRPSSRRTSRPSPGN